jgi:hypothetical protein
MNRIIEALKHPLGHAILLLVGSYVFFDFVIPLLPGSAPVPNSVVRRHWLMMTSACCAEYYSLRFLW